MKSYVHRVVLTALLAVLTFSVASAATTAPQAELTALERQVRHELITLPFLSVFDNLSFRVDGSKVVLSGQVYRPSLRRSAERVVARIEGVETVQSQIEVLPTSHFDDRIRLGLLRAIYGHSALNRYALGSQPSIRIIVKNGDVTLEGVVNREMEKNIAFLQANSVHGVFSVTNNLQVEVPAKG